MTCQVRVHGNTQRIGRKHLHARDWKNPGDSLRVFSTGSFAPTGHNEIAQGRAQRHPGYTGDLGAPAPQFAQALKGRNITHGFTPRRFRPFRAWVVSCTPIPGRRFALPWAITFCLFGAAGSMVDSHTLKLWPRIYPCNPSVRSLRSCGMISWLCRVDRCSLDSRGEIPT